LVPEVNPLHQQHPPARRPLERPPCCARWMASELCLVASRVPSGSDEQHKCANAEALGGRKVRLQGGHETRLLGCCEMRALAMHWRIVRGRGHTSGRGGRWRGAEAQKEARPGGRPVGGRIWAAGHSGGGKEKVREEREVGGR
jgi:hypothetical protein